ncbi:MAG: type I-C CRISPR-associated protein Cas7/Csd2 [Planctomycetota bacterium]|nr:type I-C CRISPR-associated protein Cas7/Csd2 [Planctomycetota bacterium]
MPTQTQLSTDNRIDFVYLFDVRDGNPNGDPDAGNSPRIDPETAQGLVSDVCLKRKVRDFVAASKNGSERHKIYVKLHSALHEQREPAYKALEIKDGGKGKDKTEEITKARAWMCQNYFDVRAFGAVMSVTEFNCGQVRGPLQFTFGRSIDPVADLEQTISRKAVEKGDAEKQLAKDGFITGTLGRKSIVPYALYRSHVFFNPHFAADTGFSAEDLETSIEALKMMFEIDRSAARGQMSAQMLGAFVHSSPLGNAPAGKLFDLIEARRKDDGRPARNFKDYSVTFNSGDLPDVGSFVEVPGFTGVSFLRLL